MFIKECFTSFGSSQIAGNFSSVFWFFAINFTERFDTSNANCLFFFTPSIESKRIISYLDILLSSNIHTWSHDF